MNLFQSKKHYNWIIKLFKITDIHSAKSFDMENCILLTIDLIHQNTHLNSSDFDLNYTISKKNLKGFQKALKSQKEIIYGYVGFNSKEKKAYFTTNNSMLNLIDQPQNSAIDIIIQIPCDFIEQKSIENIAKELLNEYDFEYGYITKLPSNYDADTERKIKKGLFSTEIEINEFDHAWAFHLVGINEGFIKEVYPINYLNKSHFINTSIKKLITQNGTTENISEYVTKWTLSSEELESLKVNQDIKKISIITPDLEFLKTKKSHEFNTKMNLKNTL